MALDPTASTGPDIATVGAASVLFTNPLVVGLQYQFTSTTNCWITIGTGSAVAAIHTAGSVYVPANFPILISCTRAANNRLAVIQDTAGGFASACVYS